MEYTCISRNRDKHGLIKSYTLKNDNEVIEMSSASLKKAISNKDLTAQNLTLTSDDRIVITKYKFEALHNSEKKTGIPVYKTIVNKNTIIIGSNLPGVEFEKTFRLSGKNSENLYNKVDGTLAMLENITNANSLVSVAYFISKNRPGEWEEQITDVLKALWGYFGMEKECRKAIQQKIDTIMNTISSLKKIKKRVVDNITQQNIYEGNPNIVFRYMEAAICLSAIRRTIVVEPLSAIKFYKSELWRQFKYPEKLGV